MRGGGRGRALGAGIYSHKPEKNWEYSGLNNRVTLGFGEGKVLLLCFREGNGLFGGFGKER